MPTRKNGTNNGKQQDIKCMFNSMIERNNNRTNEAWSNRQPGILSSPKSNKYPNKCSNKPSIQTCNEEKSIEGQTQRNRTSRKRKFNMISSPNDYNTLYIDNDPCRIKRMKSLSISPSKGSLRHKIKQSCNNNINTNEKIDLFTFNSQETKYNIPAAISEEDDINLFTSFDEDRTPARINQRMTQFRRQRVLNRIDLSGKSNQSNKSNKKTIKINNSNDSSMSRNSSNTTANTNMDCIPSSASKSSNISLIQSIKNISTKKKHRRKKIIIEREEDIDNIISIDPRRLSLEEHPLYSKPFDEITNQSPNIHLHNKNKKLTSLLHSLVNNNNSNNNNNDNNNACVEMDESIDYFDDDLDENALLMALNDIDKGNKKNLIKKRLSFDNNNNSQPSQPSQPAIDFSPQAKRNVNSPLSQRGCNKNMGSMAGSIDIMTQQSYDNDNDNNEIKDRYYRFEVIEIINDYDTYSKILRVKDLKSISESEESDIDIDIIYSNEWTVEIREDWFESLICIGDIIHVIGETVEQMRILYTKEECNNNYPIYMIPNENIPIIIDIKYDIIIDNLHNYLVIHPDCLMIPTRIASSFPCTRRQILANNIRFNEENAIFLYGNMAHELFQSTLQKGICNQFNLQNDINYIISKYLIQLYSINETEQSAFNKLSEFIPHITDFFNKFMNTNNTNNNNNNIVDWGAYKQQLQVTKLIDIEETIWSPMFGIRGNIDATVQIKTKIHLSNLERKHRKNGFNSDFIYKLLPFELKTGKDNVSAQQKARAQLAFYSLMFADRYDTSTDGGLLYFLKTGNLKGIPLPHGEIRALLIRRNFLAKYFNSHPKIDEIKQEDNHIQKQKQKRKQKQFPELLPTHQKRICQKCYSKAECFIYHKIQCYNNGISDISNNNITNDKVYNETIGHLNNTHLEYINKWIELIDLEETYCLGTRYEIWAMDSRKRELKTGKCLANMIVNNHEIDQFKHIYTFIKHPDYYYNNFNKYDKYNSNNKGRDKDIIKLWDLKFKVNDYITVSTEDGKYGLGSGSIIELNTKYVKFACKKPIKNLSEVIKCNQYVNSTQQRNDVVMYRLDIDDTAYGYSALRANILYYFYPTNTDNNDSENSNNEINEIINRKRGLLVDLLTPKFNYNVNKYFHNKIPSHLQTAYNLLNIDQQNAVRHVLECNDYALILGMPGTGKSSTIIFLLRLLISFGYKVMLSAYTNSAIDHLCLKLLKYNDVKHKFVRIGSVLSVNPKLSNYVLDGLDKNKFNSIQLIDKYLNDKNIFAVTSTSSTTHSILTSKTIKHLNIFDYCIIDEAGQLTEPQVLGPLRKCRKFILVGDNNQLPPLVQCKESKDKGMNISLFEKLAIKYKNIAVKSLTIQYRMNKDILLLSNSLTYNGQMKCASDMIAKQKIKLNNSIESMNNLWLKYALNPNKCVILFNTDNLYNNKPEKNKEKKSKNGNKNENEANMIEMIVNNLFKYGIYSSQIGVMAPYRSQLKLIKSKLDSLNVPLSPSQTLSQMDIGNDNKEKKQSSLLLDTIDRFQGSDRDIIIISFTHTKFDKKVGAILNDWRRINVALTRAKCKLILFASVSAFKNSNSNVLKRIVDIANKQNWIYNVDSY